MTSAAGEIPPRIALIGMMGSGKTAAGRRLARLLGYDFIDTDADIVAATGKSIAVLFADEGEAAFRRREVRLLRKLARRNGVVVSTGGGIVLPSENRRLLRGSFRTIWLQVPAVEVWRRLGECRDRPLLGDTTGETRLSYLRRLARSRAPLYAASGIPFRAAGKSPDQLARALARKISVLR